MTGGLDHVVIAARDLDALAETYRRFGFHVGQRNRHPWGTINHIVQMPGTFLELIATEPGFVAPAPDTPVAQFAGVLARYLERREGFAMLVLETADASVEQARMAAAGAAGPSTFFFERRGSRPDGTPVHVAFTLAFAKPAGDGDAGFFFCQQHFPESFWNPAFQVHPNGVTGVSAVTYVADDPARAVSHLAAFAGLPARAIPGGLVIDTPRGRIEILTRDAAAAVYGAGALPAGPATGHWAGARFMAPDLAGVDAALSAGAVLSLRNGGRIVIPAKSAHGVALAFEMTEVQPWQQS